MLEPISTSLGALSEHDWSIIRHQWARGWDSNIGKCGRRWQILGRLGQGFPLFKTKTMAYEYGSELVRRESLHRYWREHFSG